MGYLFAAKLLWAFLTVAAAVPWLPRLRLLRLDTVCRADFNQAYFARPENERQGK